MATEFQQDVQRALRVLQEERNRHPPVPGKRYVLKPYSQLMERDIITLWGMYREWNDVHIGEATCFGPRGVRRRRLLFTENRWRIFQCPALTQTSRRLHQRGCCSSRIPGAEVAARRHVLAHLLHAGGVYTEELMRRS